MHEPAVAPLALHTGKAGSVQLALLEQGATQALVTPPTVHAFWLAPQWVTSVRTHALQRNLTGSQMGKPGTAAQSASVAQQAAPADTWSEA